MESVFGRPEKAISWAFRACSAPFAEEIIITGMDPNLMDITGPYFLESFHKYSCGEVEEVVVVLFKNWCRFPINGSPGGPGGGGGGG